MNSSNSLDDRLLNLEHFQDSFELLPNHWVKTHLAQSLMGRVCISVSRNETDDDATPLTVSSTYMDLAFSIHLDSNMYESRLKQKLRHVTELQVVFRAGALRIWLGHEPGALELKLDLIIEELGFNLDVRFQLDLRPGIGPVTVFNICQ